MEPAHLTVRQDDPMFHFGHRPHWRQPSQMMLVTFEILIGNVYSEHCTDKLILCLLEKIRVSIVHKGKFAFSAVPADLLDLIFNNGPIYRFTMLQPLFCGRKGIDGIFAGGDVLDHGQ